MPYFCDAAEQLQRYDFFDAAAHSFTSAAAGERFERFVPADDAPGVVFNHDTDIDRLDDVLAEVLETLILAGLLLKGPIQTRIFDRDADIVRYRLEQLEIFARQIIAILRTSERKVCDHPIFDPAWNEVVQIMDIRLKKEVRTLGRGLQK